MEVEPELIFLTKGRSQSQFLNKRLVCLFLVLQIVFTNHVIT